MALQPYGLARLRSHGTLSPATNHTSTQPERLPFANMTSAEIRQSFLDFFASKKHTIVPSASLLPQSPGLLFTNAGMNQFVPYFLGTEKAPYSPPRAADTQKCIRAGGKHNDLDDVGYDSYHHTFFEMLGNWSFGDYFKAEAIQWSWELLVERWGVPPTRLYATIYAPDKEAGDPGEFDQQSYDLWADLFKSAGLDPAIHVVHGNIKDNFWMMGETGPCGPCSELHVDLTPMADSKGRMVNMDSDQCIEIWNLVFIQYNAEADGSFRDLPAKHVDTGMGFERACAIITGTNNFTDFSRIPSNYATDVFQPLFAKLEELSGETYHDIYPKPNAKPSGFSDDMRRAIAFRVIADHLRTLSFSIADGILPGNTGRNYVLRRILRRAVRYGRTLGFSGDKPFFAKLVDPLVNQMGDVFPELKARKDTILTTLEREEDSFNETLDRGLKRFADILAQLESGKTFPADAAFELYDTYGFPIDLTGLLCAERGLTIDMARFDELMNAQRQRARAARQSTVVRALDITTDTSTEFVGFDTDETDATLLEIHPQDELVSLITDKTPFYTEMGGQVGDTGEILFGDTAIPVEASQQIGNARAHIVKRDQLDALEKPPVPGDEVTLRLDRQRRRDIESHHTATHLLHWALHKVVSPDATQQGSLVAPDRLRFDFSSGPVDDQRIEEIETMVNECIAKNAPVSATEVPLESIRGREDIQQFFGEKYGDEVRVVQIGGNPGTLDGYSMELCGGTHVGHTGDIGLFKIKSEGAIASGVRRIEAACGDAAREYIVQLAGTLNQEATGFIDKLTAANAELAEAGETTIPVPSLDGDPQAELQTASDPNAVNASLATLSQWHAALRNAAVEAEKSLRKAQAAKAGEIASDTLAKLTTNNEPIVTSLKGDPTLLQELLNGLKQRQFPNAAFLVVEDDGRLHLGAYCGKEALAMGLAAGKLIQTLAPIVGGKGGGKPDIARGAGTQTDALDDLLNKARQHLTQ